MHDLVGGPFPADTVTVGLVLSGLIFLPVAFIGMNLVGTCVEAEEKQGRHGGIVFPFLFLAAVCLSSPASSSRSSPSAAPTSCSASPCSASATCFLWVYGFFSFGLFGAMYYIVPRLLDFGWRSALLIRAHYYASLYGILLVIAMLGFGGVMQGLTLENTDPQSPSSSPIEIALSTSTSLPPCASASSRSAAASSPCTSAGCC